MCTICKNKLKIRKTLLSIGMLLIGMLALFSFQSNKDKSFDENLKNDIHNQRMFDSQNSYSNNKCGDGAKEENTKKESKSSEKKCGSDSNNETEKAVNGDEDAKEETKDSKKSDDAKCGSDTKKETKCGAGKCGGA